MLVLVPEGDLARRGYPAEVPLKLVVVGDASEAGAIGVDRADLVGASENAARERDLGAVRRPLWICVPRAVVDGELPELRFVRRCHIDVGVWRVEQSK
jgi:hypothetical protein